MVICKHSDEISVKTFHVVFCVLDESFRLNGLKLKFYRKMAFLQNWTPFRQAFRVAAHPKVVAIQTRLGSFTPVRFLINVLEDYKGVAKDALQDMKTRPGKAAVYLSLLSVAFVAHKTNPTEMYYRDYCLENSNDLIQVPVTSRKPEAQNYLNQVLWLKNQDRLEFHNLGVFSVVLRRDFSDRCDLYEARCKYLKPALEKINERIVDIGVFNRWIYLEKSMKDFDVPE